MFKVVEMAQPGLGPKKSANGAPAEQAGLSAMEGGALLRWLDQVAEGKGHDRQEMARQLGVTYGYLAQLRSGIRQVNRISEDFADTCASYLQVPRIAVLRASGRITLADYEDPSCGARELDMALAYIALDAEWGASLPPGVLQGPDALKRFVIHLYERATGKLLVSRTTDCATDHSAEIA